MSLVNVPYCINNHPLNVVLHELRFFMAYWIKIWRCRSSVSELCCVDRSVPFEPRHVISNSVAF